MCSLESIIMISSSSSCSSCCYSLACICLLILQAVPLIRSCFSLIWLEKVECLFRYPRKEYLSEWSLSIFSASVVIDSVLRTGNFRILTLFMANLFSSSPSGMSIFFWLKFFSYSLINNCAFRKVKRSFSSFLTTLSTDRSISFSINCTKFRN